jgi:hypothetical protein
MGRASPIRPHDRLSTVWRLSNSLFALERLDGFFRTPSERFAISTDITFPLITPCALLPISTDDTFPLITPFALFVRDGAREIREDQKERSEELGACVHRREVNCEAG